MDFFIVSFFMLNVLDLWYFFFHVLTEQDVLSGVYGLHILHR